MLTRQLLSCSALAFALSCSASTDPPTGAGLGAQASNPDNQGAAGTGAGPISAGPGNPTDGTPDGTGPESPSGITVNDDGTATVMQDGMAVDLPVSVNDDGMMVVTTDDGTEIVIPTTMDDILEGAASGTPGCGDGTLTDDEACDDGNTSPSDGCGGDCLTIDPGFSCAIPGQPCRPIARCGDGLVAASEQCDDANATDGDGCTMRCKFELGKKCTGEPSVCTDAVCGNTMREGAEACDDGNTEPFDGCSALCLREPDCSGTSCTSECGDGLVINEDCDDGNTIDGDGCSSACALEPGFTCVQEATCEKINDACVLRVPAIFRDFPTSHPDFIETEITGGVLLEGSVQDLLDAEGRPQLNPGLDSAKTHITSAATFAEWYRDGGSAVTLVGDIVLFDNESGGFVNRFGANGEPFTSVDADTEQGAGNSLAGCATTCEARARDGQAPFEGEGNLRCDDICRPIEEDARQLRDNALNQLNNQLTQAENAAEPDADLIADLEAQIEETQAEIDALTADAEVCRTDCETELAARTAECTEMCAPCSYDPDAYCIGGVLVEWDGNPLFFPVDSITGATKDPERAKIPEQYGYNGWPWEDEWFPDAPEHNFFFTSEVQYWFRYEAGTNAQLDFTGDDDVWVFINGHLALDLGGIHVPEFGSVTINAQSANRFGLQEGNVYKITVFQAERQMYGSSFKLTLSGFEATPSDCNAVCGDGVLAFGEECDDMDNDGGYGECAPECKLGEFCGDGIINGPEKCDNGPGGGEGCPNCRKLMAR